MSTPTCQVHNIHLVLTIKSVKLKPDVSGKQRSFRSTKVESVGISIAFYLGRGGPEVSSDFAFCLYGSDKHLQHSQDI